MNGPLITECPNLFSKLTNNFEAFMDSTTNMLHVQVAQMLAFILWDSIGKKFDISSNNYLDLLGLITLCTICEQVVCKYEHVRELSICNCNSILNFAFCKLHLTKFAGGKKRLFQTNLRL